VTHLRRPFSLLCVFTLAGFAACSDEDNPADGGDETGTIGGIATKHTEPHTLIAAHAQAISEKNIAAYEALLVPSGDDALPFEFCPRAGDVPDFPWMQGDCWDYGTEIDMMTNMFDPEYSSPEAMPVQSIEMDVDVRSLGESASGSTLVDCTATIIVFVGPYDGFFTDTRFLFDLVEVDGFLHIRRIEEVDRWKAGPAGGRRSPEPISWARIKALYRTP
jgi:hypothetical protein